MARKKRNFMEDDGDSSDASDDGDDQDNWRPDETPDERAERELFERPYGRKRKRPTNDDEADEDEGFGGKRAAGRAKTDWTKAPSFVSSGRQKTLEKATLSEGDESSAEEEEEEAAEAMDEDDEDAPEVVDNVDDMDEDEVFPEARVKEPSPDEQPRARPGLGGARSMASAFFSTQSSDSAPTSGAATPRGGIGSGRTRIGMASLETPSEAPTPSPAAPSSRGGIGSGRGGIGSTATTTLPTGFGPSTKADGRPRTFMRAQPVTTAPANLTPQEKRHFDTISNTFGAKLMQKMGWEAGTGLGLTGSGIITPIETKLRPTKAGIAFRGFKEKTEQSKAEARRRGEKVSDDEDAPRKGRKKQGADRSDMWKKPAKKVKTKVEHKTYEELIKEAGVDGAAAAAAAVPGVGIIIDATGPQMREVSSLSELPSASWTAPSEPTRLPEVRHNLRLIVDMAKGDLDGLAREGKALDERGKYLAGETTRLGGIIRAEAELIAKLQKIRIVVDEIAVQAREIASTYEPSLDPFAESFEKLIDEFGADYDKLALDEVVVGAMTPVVRRMVANWDPLAAPAAFSSDFERWKRAFRMSQPRPPDGQIERLERVGLKVPTEQKSTTMTPYESLMWNVWLPKVRSSINNSWSPSDPEPAIQLYTTWSPVLPEFLSANILDQLVLPKLTKAVSEWTNKNPTPLHSIVFPWLPYVGLRSVELMGEAKRKVKGVLKNWPIEDGLWQHLALWRDIFQESEWDAMILKYIVPKLGAVLRDDFKVNPRNQKMDPLDYVLAWKDLLRPKVLSQLLETQFFPKWLDTLHFWLIQPKTNFEDVAQWYSFWKQYFPPSVVKLEAVKQGFNRGLHLMSMAMELGPNAPYQLPRPETLLPKHKPTVMPASNGVHKSAKPQAAEVTFRSIVEEFVAAHNLLFIPTGQAHEHSRMPLFRVSPNVDGKGGVTVYLLDDAVWAQDGSLWKAIGLEEMVLRANRAAARQR